MKPLTFLVKGQRKQNIIAGLHPQGLKPRSTFVASYAAINGRSSTVLPAFVPPKMFRLENS
jgi:hypothetical protein